MVDKLSGIFLFENIILPLYLIVGLTIELFGSYCLLEFEEISLH